MGLCEDSVAQLKKIAQSGADALILRAKELDEEEYTDLAERVLEIFKGSSTEVILHSFVGAAKKLGVNSIHLPLGLLRDMSDEDKARFETIGASCHSVEEAAEAERLGVSYITAGHIFETDCKKGLAGRGLGFLGEVCKRVEIPVYAIGGIGAGNAFDVKKTGAAGVCVMSGFMKTAAPREFSDKLKRVMKMRISGKQLELYAITDRKLVEERGLCACVEAALKGGATIIQLRDKNVSREELVREARELLPICRKYSAPLIINDDWQAAIEAGADGVHVGIEDTPVEEIRKQAAEGFIIGATAKTVEQARAAQAAGADYLGVGAVFPSPTKTNAIRITNEQLREITASVDIPAVAIGGISYENIAKLKGCGADGFAVVSAVFGAEDIEESTKALREKAKQVLEEK